MSIAAQAVSPTFAHVPGMRHAAPVPELDASTLTQGDFMNDYVVKSRPCVIKGAVRHWPASSRWRDRDYLKRRSGHHDVYYYPHENFVSQRRQEVDEVIVSLGDALDRLAAPETRIGLVCTATPVEWLPDMTGFAFLGQMEPAFFYSLVRYFLYRNAGTTWHYHPFDETLMCQVIGAKKVGLLAVNNPHYLDLRKIFFQEDYYDDPFRFAGLENLAFFSAHVEEGDALYIPPLWWHGVVPMSDGFGLTAAVPWRSPPPVIASSIRKMAAGHADIMGKSGAMHVPALVETARTLGLENELAAAWQRGS